jgi:Zn-dependent protease
MLERISRRELFDLTVAWLAISIAFAIIFAKGGSGELFVQTSLVTFLMFLGISLVTVGIGFILHEMAHKFTAIHYGYHSEFRKNDVMLVIAILLAALVGFVFAAPGATLIFGHTTREQSGKISAMGPLTNLILCIPFAAMVFGSQSLVGAGLGPILATIGFVGLNVNAMIAAFNMLPISVLDGKKVLSWNVGVFLILIVASFGLLIALYYPTLLATGF